MRTLSTRARLTRWIPIALVCVLLLVPALAGCTGSAKTGGSGTTGGAGTSTSDDPVEAAKAYEVTGVKMEKIAEGLPTVTVTGKLTNNGTKTYKAVMLTADLYKGGAKIEAPEDMISGDAANDLKPGASMEFSVTFMAVTPEQDAAMARLLEADEAKAVVSVLTALEQ